MQYRILGRTGLKVSAIGFGGIKLPHVDAQTASDALNRALDLGVNFVDTARNYRDSEEKIGAALKTRRGEYYVATKTSARDAAKARAELETSLRNLQTDYVDLYQLHTVSDPECWQQVMGPDGALEAVRQARDEGLVKHVGITIHRALDVMEQAIKCGEFETIMLAYSPLDQEGVERDILPLATAHNVGVIIMKPLSGGQLCLPPEQRPAEGDPIVRDSLRHILSNPNVTVAIPGMTSVAEVEWNTAVASPFTPLTDGERERLIEAISGLKREFRYGQVCLRCGYCQPCPQGVPIPEIFRAWDMVRDYPASLRHLGYELYESLEVTAEACEECGQCVEQCPAGLPIPERLREAHKALTAAS